MHANQGTCKEKRPAGKWRADTGVLWCGLCPQHRPSLSLPQTSDACITMRRQRCLAHNSWYACTARNLLYKACHPRCLSGVGSWRSREPGSTTQATLNNSWYPQPHVARKSGQPLDVPVAKSCPTHVARCCSRHE